jgi:protein-disulfide isomerase
VSSAETGEPSWKRGGALVAAGIAVGVILAAVSAGRSCGKAPPPPARAAIDVAAFDDSASPVPVTAEDPMSGDRDALVTLVMFGNFQCPHSAKAQSDLATLKSELGPKKLRLVWKTLVVATHDKSRAAGVAGAAVHTLGGNDAFFKFHDLAFKNRAFLGPESYLAWGAEAGVDKLYLHEALSDAAYERKVEADGLLAKSLGIDRTPTYVVNGVVTEGPTSLADLRAVVSTELRKAEAKVASGTPPARVYVAVSKENRQKKP